MSLVLVMVLVVCGKYNSQFFGNGKYVSSQVLNLLYFSLLDLIDIFNMLGYGSMGNIFESLYWLGKNGSIILGLVKFIKVLKDGKMYIFMICNVKWSDGLKIIV